MLSPQILKMEVCLCHWILAKRDKRNGKTLWYVTFFNCILPYNVVKQQAFLLWNGLGLKEVREFWDGLFLFIFENDYGTKFVLDNGPCFMLKQAII